MGKKQDNSYLQKYDNFTLIIFFKDDTRCVDKYLLAKRDSNNVYSLNISKVGILQRN